MKQRSTHKQVCLNPPPPSPDIWTKKFKKKRTDQPDLSLLSLLSFLPSFSTLSLLSLSLSLSVSLSLSLYLSVKKKKKRLNKLTKTIKNIKKRKKITIHSTREVTHSDRKLTTDTVSCTVQTKIGGKKRRNNREKHTRGVKDVQTRTRACFRMPCSIYYPG